MEGIAFLCFIPKDKTFLLITNAFRSTCRLKKNSLNGWLWFDENFFNVKHKISNSRVVAVAFLSFIPKDITFLLVTDVFRLTDRLKKEKKKIVKWLNLIWRKNFQCIEKNFKFYSRHDSIFVFQSKRQNLLACHRPILFDL